MTPLSGSRSVGKIPIRSAKGTRWVIQGAVLIRPASIRPMIRAKSRERALRLARS